MSRFARLSQLSWPSVTVLNNADDHRMSGGTGVKNYIPLIQRGRGTRPDEAPATLQPTLVDQLSIVPRGSRLGKVPNPSHGEMRREEDEEKGPRLTWLCRLSQAAPTPP